MLRLDVLDQVAARVSEERGVPVATQPLVTVDDPLLRASLPPESVPIGDITEFATQAHNQPVERLGAMILHLEPGRPGTGGGFWHGGVEELDGQLYYPIISINALARNPNWWMTHELRHPFQKDKGALPYNSALARWGVRLAGAASLAGALLTADLPPDIGTLIWAGSSVVPLASPYTFLHTLTPDEVDAQLFALHNRDFRPIPRPNFENIT